MLAVAGDMAAHSFSFGQALRDLASLLHRIALAQQAGEVGDEIDHAADVHRLAAAMTPEEVQLYYQIALHGRNDLGLAPDEYAGFTMALLRMLAFAPREDGDATTVSAPRPMARTTPAVPARVAAAAGAGSPGKDAAAPIAATAAPIATSVQRSARATPLPDATQWPQFVSALPLVGLVREMASHSELLAASGDQVNLRVAIKAYAEAGIVEKLRAALSQHLGRPVRLSVEVGSTGGASTAAAVAQQARAERQRKAEQSILADPFVKDLIENFGAEVEPQSIRPRET
jgi:DNA polymerase-3 subunit gamma/tau